MGLKNPRGILISIESSDPCKALRLVNGIYHRLLNQHIKVHKQIFPARDTPIGIIIDQYLMSQNVLDDRCLSLLISANHYEFLHEFKYRMLYGETVITSRYIASQRGFIKPDVILSGDRKDIKCVMGRVLRCLKTHSREINYI